MPNRVDLHTHSIYSDGHLTIVELLHRAMVRGIKYISVTDHDTMDQVLPAMKVGEALGIKVIPGTELSVTHEKKNFHLLGYNFDPNNTELKNELERQKILRFQRLVKIAKLLQANGWKFSFDKILSLVGSVGKPQIAKIVFDDPLNAERCEQEGIESFNAFIDRYLVKGALAYVKREKFSFEAGVRLIHNAGGIAVWAHPLWNLRKNSESMKAILEELIEFGLDGVEVFYGPYSKEQTCLVYELAKKHRLFMTMGSDFHYDGRPGFPDLGGWQDHGLDVPSIKELIA